MEKPEIPDIFAVLFFNNLVQDGWSIEIEPSTSLWSRIEGRIAMGCIVRFEKGDTRFKGEGLTLDQAIGSARASVERELERIRIAIVKAGEMQ